MLDLPEEVEESGLAPLFHITPLACTDTPEVKVEGTVAPAVLTAESLENIPVVMEEEVQPSYTVPINTSVKEIMATPLETSLVKKEYGLVGSKEDLVVKKEEHVKSAPPGHSNPFLHLFHDTRPGEVAPLHLPPPGGLRLLRGGLLGERAGAGRPLQPPGAGGLAGRGQGVVGAGGWGT